MNIQPWRRYSRDQIRKIIFKRLLGYPFGVTISKLSKDMNLSRIVVREEINKLYWLEMIRIVKIGNIRLFIRKQYFNKRYK